MNDSLRAVIIEVSGGNLRNHHVNLRGTFGLFPDDCLGGTDDSKAGKFIRVQIGAEKVETDIDQVKAIFRKRGAIRRFFEAEAIVEGDLLILERVSERSYRLAKASKRGFKYYL